jgi:signal transduction histidine kinase
MTELLKLINDWQKIVSIDSKKIAENMEELKLKEIIKNVIEDVKISIPDKKMEFTIEIPKDISIVYGDKLRIKEVFTNLINNAVKYNHENGKVEITATEDEKYLIVSISDNGIGIGAKYLPFIFDEFFRVRNDSNFVLGAGLGLFIVKKIIEAHSGKIEVTSEVGKGSTFTVFFPKGRVYG